MRLNYPSNVKVVKVPCTGRVDVLLILKAFESGADGVYVAGCMEGECNFLRGNIRARRRVEYAKTLLDEVGLGAGRVEMYNMSASDGQRFAQCAREMTAQVRSLGPTPVKKGKKEVLP